MPRSSGDPQHATAGRPSPKDLRRWRQYLADERAEAAVYRDLASRRTGEERAILLELAEAEGRHADHWLELLGPDVGRPLRGDWRTRTLAFLARRFGSVFVLALAQRAEARSEYATEADATATMAADEQIHEEVVRGLAIRGRNRISGTFRAAVFGANDGLVSNLALVLGVGASGVGQRTVLITGIAGLLAGALSMAAGEFVSVRSQRELLAASTPDPRAREALPHLDVDANELALVYRARGMSPDEASRHAREVLDSLEGSAGAGHLPRLPGASGAVPAGAAPGSAADGSAAAHADDDVDEHEAIGSAVGAAASSFCFFGSGALIPVLPYLLGLQGLAAIAVAAVLVGLALLATGATVGILSGGPPLRRALRQLAIGYGAAGVTYVLGLLFGTTVA
jgi:VIT1/CCC1 family predicted Fe2+/Mn2+ transporter